MFTDELHIMDRNMERPMVSELQDKVNELRNRVDAAEAARNAMLAERNIFKLRLEGKTSEEIAKELLVSIENVEDVLGGNAIEPAEWMLTFTDKLHIMDRNMERLMVKELQDEVNELKNRIATARAEHNAMRDAMLTEQNIIQIESDVIKLCLEGKTSEEIAEELSISIEKVNEILEESN